MGCYKQCYTKKQALTILNERKSMGKKWAKEVREYFCPKCNAHHLTSWEEYNEREEIDLIFKDEWKKLRAM